MATSLLNRRQVLSAGACGCAGLCWRRWLPAAADLERLSFVLVSDTHLGRNDNDAAEKNWRTAIDEISSLDAKFVLHLGDVVDSGRPAQYPIYAKLRESLNKPIHEIPGNHDPVDLFREHIAAQTDRVVDDGGVRFVLFNNAHRDSHDGFITVEQNAWIAEQCDAAARDDLKIVISCHVPVHTNRHPDRGWYVKPDDGQTAFYETLERHADRILACLHGHFHNGIRGWRDHRRTVEVLLPSVCYNQNRGLKEKIAAGDADGFFVDELRAGYVLAELGRGMLTLRYKPLGAASDGTYTADWS